MIFRRSSSSALTEPPQLDPTAPLMSLKGVEKSFPVGAGQTFVLRRVALDIKAGEFVSIMGPSGAGKSTLLHILGMHDSAWSGEYHLMGHPIHALSQKDRAALQKRHIGFVFQSYHLLDNLTVYENIELPLSYRDVKKSERQGTVANVLDRFGIVAKKDLYPNQLSGGQQQLGRRRARDRRQPGGHPRRRADGQPALIAGPGDHGAVQAAQRSGHDHHPGDSLGSERRLRRSHRQAARRIYRAKLIAA